MSISGTELRQAQGFTIKKLYNGLKISNGKTLKEIFDPESN